MSSEHQEYLRRHCRVCSKLLGKVKYECEKYLSLLNHLGVDSQHDDEQIHPPSFCNVCYMTAKRISRSLQHHTQILPVLWVPHDGAACMCKTQCKGGRPKKKTSSGRPSQLQQHIRSVASKAIPEFELSQVTDRKCRLYLTCALCGQVTQ